MARPLKQIERWGKAVAVRALAKILPERVASPPDWSARSWRALYLRYDRIGDMILSSGLFRVLVTRHPRITLDVLASPSNRSVLAGNPRVHQILSLDRKRWTTLPATLRAIRRNRYDIVLDPMVEKPSLIATLLMLVSGARYRVGVGGRDNAFAYTLPVRSAGRDVHHAMQEAVLLEAFGIDCRRVDLRPELFTDDAQRVAADRVWGTGRARSERTPVRRAAVPDAVDDGPGHGARLRLLLNISTHHPSRLWPEARFAQLIRHVRAARAESEIVVIGLPRDRAMAESIARAGGARAVHTPALSDALALVASADVVVTPDTGISHAASAFRKPAVVMMGPGRAAFEPFANTGRTLRATTHDFASISAMDVVEALDEILAVLPLPQALTAAAGTHAPPG